jgi:hypothetical protein
MGAQIQEIDFQSPFLYNWAALHSSILFPARNFL